MANTIDETKAEIQIGQGWEGVACPIIVKGTTHSYRNIIRKIATSDDVAVEIGSATGKTTIILGRICKRVIGVDFNHKCIQESIDYATKNGFRTSYKDEENDDDEVERSDRKPVVEFVQIRVVTESQEKCLESLRELEQVLKNKHGHSLKDVSLLAVDIAGTAPIDMVTSILNSLRQIMRPRITVVKSLSLKKLSVALETGQNYLV